MKIPSYLYNRKYSGIYCIENSINNKRYIGSSKNVYSRLHKHKALLNSNKHENIILQNSVNKRGIDVYECYLIELVENVELLTEKEQFWINELNPEYNITKEVVRNIPSKESKLKMSISQKRTYLNGRINPKAKSIEVYNLDGDYLQTFVSINECSRTLNIHTSSIIRVLRGHYKQAKGYQFKYTEDNLTKISAVTKSKYLRRFDKKS